MGITYYSVFKNSNGDVGIGTTSPTAQSGYRFLQVNGSTSAIIEATVGGTRIGGFDSTASALYVGSIGSYPVIFRTAVDEKMRISANGNVGIGTSSPSTRLHVYSDANQPILIQGTTAGTWMDFQSSTSNLLSIGADGTRGIGFYNRTTAADLMTISSAGNVGIGTTSPSQLLEVAGSSPIIRVLATSGNATLRLTDNGVRNWDLKVVDTSDYFEVGGTNTTSLIVTGTGNVGIGTTSPSNTKLHVVADWVSGHSTVKVQGITDNTTGYGFYDTAGSRLGYLAYTGAAFEWYNNANVPMIFYTNTSEKMRIASGGNVGIGTTSPTQKLEVAGFVMGGTTYRTSIGASGSGAYIYFGDTSNLYSIGRMGGYNSLFNISSFNGPISFQISDSEKVRIDSNGNVGIGTTSPASLLHLQSSAATTLLRIDSSNTDNDAAILLTDNNNPTGEGLKITYDSSVGDTYFNNIYTSSTRAFNFQKGNFGSGTDLLTILNNGNVGIGTSSPGAPLTIYKASNPWIRINGGGAFSYIQMDDGTSYGYLFKNTTSDTSNGALAGAMYTYTDSGKAFQHIHSGVPLFTILSGGNIGIGTTSPSVKLTVSGDVTDSDVGQFRAVGSTSAAKMINVGYHTTSNYGFISALIAGTGYSALSLQPNGGNVGIATVSPDVRLHVINGTTKLNKNNYKTTTAYSTADLVLGDDISSRTGYAGNGSNLVLHANGTTSITFLDQTRNLGEITYSNRLFTIGGDIGWGTASVSFPGTVNFGTNIYHSIGGQKFFAGSGGNYAYIYTGGVALNFLNSTDTSTLMTVLNGGNVGIGTTSPAFALDVTGGVGLNTSGTGVSVTIGANNTSDRYLRIRNSNGNFEIGSAGNQHYLYGIGASNYFSIYTNVTERMRITADGVVLIGATSAYNSSRLLQVKDGLLIGNSLYTFASIDTNSSADLILSSNANPANLGANSNIIFKLGTSGGGGPTERMRIVSDGNVGIGTSSPSTKLHLYEVGASDVALRLTAGNGSYDPVFQMTGPDNDLTIEGFEIWYDNDVGDVHLSTTYPNDAAAIRFHTRVGASKNTSNERLTILGNGNVGIGSSSPAYKLDVNTANDSAIRIRNGGGGANNGLALSVGSGSPWLDITEGVEFRIKGNTYANIGTWNSGNNTKLLIDSNGNIGIGTTSPNAKLVIDSSEPRFRLNISGTNHIILNHDGSTAILRTESNTPFTFGTNGTEKMRIAAGGNVGIGTSNPISLLQIAGTTSMFPTYDSVTGYSYFLRMGYDTSGSYDYTIKRNGTTGFLEFNGTQGSPYVSYVFAGGDVYSGASGGTVGGFYFNSSSHGIRRATGTNDVYCFTTSGTLYLGAGGSSTTHVRVLSGGDVGIGVSPSYKLDVNGNIHGTGFPTSSDVRFKKNITPLQNSLEKIKKLQGVKYEWNEFVNSRRDGYKLNIPIIGLIAQDVEQVVPEIVDHWKLSDDCQDARSIDYPRLIPLLIEAIKEQQNQIEELRNEIKSLKSN